MKQHAADLIAHLIPLPVLLNLAVHVLSSSSSTGSRFNTASGAPTLASFRKIHGLPISKTVRTADSTIIIITNFYLAASSHEIFLTVGRREGMKGLGALQRHQLPHPPCKNPGSATEHRTDFKTANITFRTLHCARL